ncbi:DEKNAAC104867 [Brettanomyces naardenensis]|uniref:Transcription factor MBP1 n=1 Tax=Brettanomyces naardenensis TaxID=13370 RepID=A0A448YSE9_BRENA|nr:DEKNAAC104867 [Brettanomyces naardenensis]
MRRKKDGWVNATHILKVANFPKAKRTRILERDVQTGIHEKVQGGYGKYQGTWVPLSRAVQLAKQFGVFADLQPLLEYTKKEGSATPPPAPKHHHASSGAAKKAAKAHRSATMPAIPVKSLSSKLEDAIPVKRAYSSIAEKPAARRGRRRTLKAPTRSASRLGSLQAASGSVSSATGSVTPHVESSSDSDSFQLDSDSDAPVPVRTHSGRNLSENSSQAEFLSDADLDKALSTERRSQRARSQERIRQQLQLSEEERDPKKIHTQKLLEYFLSSEDNGNTPLPLFIANEESDTSFDLNQPIDKDGNTIFHWACAMGDLKMCQALLNRGCNFRALNDKGEVPIMRSVMYTNSYTRRTFAKMLDLLRDSLLDADTRGRTLLHHIAFSTSCHTNLPAARYHTEILLTKIAETVQPMERIINYINQQDDDGNTALHIMSFNGARKCIRILLGYNARIDIPNARNEFVSDYLYNNNLLGTSGEQGIGSQQTQGSFNAVTGSAADSFDHLRPFNPSFGIQKQLPRPSKSLLSPTKDLATANARPSRLGSSFFTSSFITVPHYSEAAMQVSQRSGELVEKLGQLANSFDDEVQQKDSDAKELRSILVQLEHDIKRAVTNIGDVLGRMLDKKVYDPNTQPFEKGIELVDVEAHNLEAGHEVKTEQLRRLIERSQAKDLAMIVQKLETEELTRMKESTEKEQQELASTEFDRETMRLLLELVKLQIIRKQTVNELVGLYADASKNTEMINNYRHLVSRLSSVPLDEVDESLNDIEDCLKKDASN